MANVDATVSKILDLPASLLQEVDDFVEFLLRRKDRDRWQVWTHFAESLELAGQDFATCLSDWEDYEDRLARGEIQW